MASLFVVSEQSTNNFYFLSLVCKLFGKAVFFAFRIGISCYIRFKASPGVVLITSLMANYKICQLCTEHHPIFGLIIGVHSQLLGCYSPLFSYHATDKLTVAIHGYRKLLLFRFIGMFVFHFPKGCPRQSYSSSSLSSLILFADFYWMS